MPSIKISVPHKLGAQEAKLRIAGLVKDAKSKFGGMLTDVRETWTGDIGHFTFTAMGFPISGTLQVEEALVNVEVNLPFAALPFKSKIENELATKARALLA